MTPLLITLTGGLGALSRFGFDKLSKSVITRWRTRNNSKQSGGDKRLWEGWGIILVNLTGCFLVGLVGTSPLFEGTSKILQAGFLGGYTTFSTAILDTIGYAWKPCFTWKYAFKSALIVAFTIAGCIVSALIGAWMGAKI